MRAKDSYRVRVRLPHQADPILRIIILSLGHFYDLGLTSGPHEIWQLQR